MANRSSSFMDFWKDCTEEQQDIIRHNLLQTIEIVDELVLSAVEHLETSHNNCLKCCVGVDVPLMLQELNDKQMFMVLTVALRSLAEYDYEKKVKAGT